MAKFTPEQLGKLTSEITPRLGKCPNCGGSRRRVLDAAFHLVSIDGANGLISSTKGTEYVPLAVVVCDDCANTTFFHLFDMGVLEK